MIEAPPKTGAGFARGKSKQDYATPADFITAVEKRFGRPTWDLAADASNTKAPNWFDLEHDSLAQEWDKLTGLLWLNPPFANIAPWAKKCAETLDKNCDTKILFLTPASVGSNWWRDYVHRKAFVFFLNGRLCFDGVAGFPKDCSLACYGFVSSRFYEVWDWRKNLQ